MNREVPTDKELQLLATRTGEALLARGDVAALAESCTGGYVAKLLTDVAGSSGWFDFAHIRELGSPCKVEGCQIKGFCVLSHRPVERC